MNKTKGLDFIKRYTMILVLIVVTAFFAWRTGGAILLPMNVSSLISQNAYVFILATGMLLCILTGGNIDLSVGSVVCFVGAIGAVLMVNMKMNMWLAILIMFVIGTLIGAFQGFWIAYVRIPPFIVTLAGMFFGRGMTSIISTDMISIKNATFMAWDKYKIYMPFGSYSKRGKFLPAYIYPTVIIAIIVLIVIIIVMKYTKFGRSVYAIGGNEQSALMMGLNVKRTKMAAYLLDGFLAGLGGFLFCMNSCAGFVEQAKGLEMDAISAAVIGGTLLSGGVGTPFGTLFGVLIKGTISSLITTQGTLSSWWVRIVLSALLCFFIVLQSVFASLKKKN